MVWRGDGATEGGDSRIRMGGGSGRRRPIFAWDMGNVVGLCGPFGRCSSMIGLAEQCRLAAVMRGKPATACGPEDRMEAERLENEIHPHRPR